jgi:hypothetical protein
MGHLEGQRENELLHVVAVREACISKDVAVVPVLLNDSSGMIDHAAGLFTVS